ncbi:MAG TPA: hypothetical protein VFW87_07870 [Pirellulales bacterium]|nr:hypothetical protein [Pirellulales bacterium]
MKRGSIVIVIILAVAVIAACTSVWYHYRNQYRAQEFWGASTAQLIDKAPAVEILQVGEPSDLSLAGDADTPPEQPRDPDAPPAPQAVEFNQTPWAVLETKDARAAKGIANLRRALVLDTTFDWESPPGDAPVWQYGVSANDGKNWATVLFDFESRQVGLAGGQKTARLEDEANREFKGFFVEQFPQKPATKDSAEKTVGKEAEQPPASEAEKPKSQPPPAPQ